MKIYDNVCNKNKYIFEKTLSLSMFYIKCGHEYGKIFKEKESIEVIKIIGLITNVEEYQKIYSHIWK